MKNKIIKGAGILCYARDTQKFLLGKRSKTVSNPGTWVSQGGGFEPGEQEPVFVALREFREESGYQGRDCSIKLFEILIYLDKHFKFYNYIGLIDKQFEPSPTPEFSSETDEFKWFSFDEMCDIPNKHFGLKSLLVNKRKIKKIITHEAY